MDKNDALAALAALAQDTRLDAFRLLVRHEPHGLAAGEAAAQLAVPQNTLSTHLAILARAGLVSAQRQGRSIVYRAGIERLQALSLYLLRDCCGASAEQCAPLLTTACCTQPGAKP
ncbi:MAG TPA: helix-turn-helix transcriptional regulator [Rhodanobacteraceae bacterium]|nr:helix-turn-helix transcriptional regulator [Rhodanobacteraceae bacterium]